ncbi:MAG: N-acetylmuramoyl-L-alanine amidase family protein [Bacteroidota bacterium]
MKNSLLTVLLLIIIASHYACKTSQLIQAGRVKKPEAINEFRIKEYFIPGESLITTNNDVLRANIKEAIEEADNDGCNSLFIRPENLIENDPGLLNYAIEKAHSHNLKFYIVTDLLKKSEAIDLQAFHEVKRSLKNRINNYVFNYNIDGLSFEIPPYSEQDSLLGGNELTDLLEDAVVEAMLVKPYLLNTLIHTGESAGDLPKQWLQQGIVDAIITGFGNYETTTGPREHIYPDSLKVNYRFKQVLPQQVVGLNFSAYFDDNAAGKTIYLESEDRTKITDSEGFVGFITQLTDTIRLQTSKGNLAFPTRRWSIPYNYSVMPGNNVTRTSPWVEFRRMPSGYTTNPEYDLLCKTDYPARVSIEGKEVKQYKTGIFFKSIILEEGPNRVRATVVTPDSQKVFYEREFFFEEIDARRSAFPLWIDGASVEPAHDFELLPDDVMRISFKGSLGQEAYITVQPGGPVIRCSREDFEDHSLYRADLPMHDLRTGVKYSLTLKLIPLVEQSGCDPYNLETGKHFTIKELEDFPMVRIKSENTRLTYNLGAPRLGGPIRSELDPGIIFKINGSFGDKYRVRLSRVENGFLDRDDVEILPTGVVQPSYYITSMSCSPSSYADVLSIPYLEPVPWEIHPDPENNRIIINLYGVKTSSTWISHYAGLKIIDRISWEQSTPETYRVYVNLKTKNIWGYDIDVEGPRLVLRLKYPPEYDLEGEKTLAGLKIAIEAGHGGSNTGAIGLSGLLEKDINLDLSLRLGNLLKQMGAAVIQVRDSDTDMSLIEKRDSAISSGADMLISIHANAGGRGYLSVDGTSTYYHNPFWAPLAETIYKRLLEMDLDEFGVVGSFNYTGIRLSEMPSVLVEQAFMSHAEDEEKMADPAFRQQMAEKIYQGILDYLKYLGAVSKVI